MLGLPKSPQANSGRLQNSTWLSACLPFSACLNRFESVQPAEQLWGQASDMDVSLKARMEARRRQRLQQAEQRRAQDKAPAAEP